MANHLVLNDAPRRSFIATENFFDYFKSYSTRVVDFVTVGTFGNAAANCTQTPKGRILRENGRKLFPGANPNVDNYMIGVYDAETFLNGFIDPNIRAFALFNTEKPNFLDNNVDEPDGDDIGNPVFTRGNIQTTEGAITAGDVTSSTYVALDASTGKTYQTGAATFFNTCGNVTLDGASPSVATVTFNAGTFQQTPLILLTPQGSIDALWVASRSSTGFTINGTNGSTVAVTWFAIGQDTPPLPEC
jgi:hypothetical protein